LTFLFSGEIFQTQNMDVPAWLTVAHNLTKEASILIEDMLTPDVNPSRMTTRRYKEAVNILRCADVSSLSIMKDPSDQRIQISALIHRKLTPRTWFVSRVKFPLGTSEPWTNSLFACPCVASSDERSKICSHCIALLLLFSSIQQFNPNPRFHSKFRTLPATHPLLFYNSARESNLSWMSKLEIFCSRSPSSNPTHRRCSFSNQTVPQVYIFKQSKPKKRGRARTSDSAAPVPDPSVSTGAWVEALRYVDAFIASSILEPTSVPVSQAEQSDITDPPTSHFESPQLLISIPSLEISPSSEIPQVEFSLVTSQSPLTEQILVEELPLIEPNNELASGNSSEGQTRSLSVQMRQLGEDPSIQLPKRVRRPPRRGN